MKLLPQELTDTVYTYVPVSLNNILPPAGLYQRRKEAVAKWRAANKPIGYSIWGEAHTFEFSSPPVGATPVHYGIDILFPEKQSIILPLPTKVISHINFLHPVWGGQVILDTPGDCCIILSRLNPNSLPTIGEELNPGTIIGEVSSLMTVMDYPHLHLQLMRKEALRDTPNLLKPSGDKENLHLFPNPFSFEFPG